MKHIYKLSAEDIASILAKHFKCSSKDVHVRTKPETVGYGPGEHTEYKAVAEVEIEIKE